MCVNFCLVSVLNLIRNWCEQFPWSYHSVLLLYVIFGLLALYSKFVTTFLTDSAGRNLTYRFNPVSVVISCFNA